MKGFVLVIPVSTRGSASIIPIRKERLNPNVFQLDKCSKSIKCGVEFHTSGQAQMGFNARANYLAKAVQCEAYGKEYACHTIVVTGLGRSLLSLEMARILQQYANQKHWKE